MSSFHGPVRSAVVSTAGFDSVSLSVGTPGGTPGEPAGEDARATTVRFKVRGQFKKEQETADEPTHVTLAPAEILKCTTLDLNLDRRGSGLRLGLRLR